jgi:AraC family transcriptional regulator, exoenzyme S synthesis regulatory protein ExsA
MIRLPKYFHTTDHFRKINIGEILFIEYRNYSESAKNRVQVDENLIIFVLNGCKKIYTPEKVYSLNENDALFIRKGTYLMSEIPFRKGKYESILFFLNENLIKEFIRNNPELFTKIKISQQSSPAAYPFKVTGLLKGFYQSVFPYFEEKNHEQLKPLLKLKFSELLFNLATKKENRELIRFISGLPFSSKIDIEKVMEENFHLNLSLAEFAIICGRSVSTFKRDFFKKFRTTPGKWILSKRLHHAKFLLTTTDKTVSEVAYECGFEEPAHFTKSFKKQFKATPSQFQGELLEQ